MDKYFSYYHRKGENMQKWEYCVLSGFRCVHRIETKYPCLAIFSVNGLEYKNFSKGNEDVPIEVRNKREEEFIPAIISKMGLQGWELVSAEMNSIDPMECYLVFKRQIEDRPEKNT